MQQPNNYRTYLECFFGLAAALFVLAVFPLQARSEVVDRVVAIVNDDVITLSELEEEAAPLYTSIAKNKGGESLLDSLEQARGVTLDNMILQKLITQKSKKYKLSVTEEEITQTLARMKEKADEEGFDFQQRLAMSGMDEESYRKRLGTQLLQNKLLSFDVRSKIVITDDMLKTYYDKTYTTKVEEGTYYLLQIGFSWKTDPSDDPNTVHEAKTKAKTYAERIRKLALGGQDFKELARKYSELPSAADGGDLGTFTLDDMADAMRAAIQPLKAGEISEIIETPTNFQFYKLLAGKADATTVSTVSFDEVKEKIRNTLYEEQLKGAYDSWVKELKENAFIQKL